MAATKGETQSRSDLVATIAANAGIAQSQVDNIVRDYENHIIQALSSGGEIRLAGFGNFKTSDRAARTARNPQTGAPIKVAARRVARFTPAKVMKDSVAGTKGAGKSGAKSASKGAAKAGASKSGGGNSGASKSGSSSGGASGASKSSSKSSGVHKAAVTLGRAGSSKGGAKKSGK